MSVGPWNSPEEMLRDYIAYEATTSDEFDDADDNDDSAFEYQPVNSSYIAIQQASKRISGILEMWDKTGAYIYVDCL